MSVHEARPSNAESTVFEAKITQQSLELYGPRLRGLFLFGSRVIGTARADSDWDVGVWLSGPIRRRDTWLPWVAAFGDWPERLDPTFFTQSSLDDPSGWLLEAARAGLRVIYDPTNTLVEKLARIDHEIRAGRVHRQLFMGLPYYRRAVTS